MSEPATLQPESAQFPCPACASPITYYDVAGSEYYACPNCHTYFRYSGEEKPKILGTYEQAPRVAPVLRLGTVGELKGRRYRVVGVVARHEAKYPQYGWREYQLFELATARYVQLAEFDGHWTLIWTAESTEQDADLFRVAEFSVFNKYKSRINWALGEFDWDIETDRSLNVTERIRPPYLLVEEQRGKQRHWYRGRYVEPAELAAAFNLAPAELPSREGIGATQPAPGRTSWPAVRALAALVVSLLLLVQLGLAGRPNPVLLNETLRVVADTTVAPGTGKVLVSPTFTLAHQAALEVDLTATLTNQWLELPVSLVNEQTGRGFEFTKNIEFYNGVEDGESWSEGSRSTEAILSRVPAGKYHLNFYPFTEKGVAPEIQVTVQAVPAPASNFFIVLLLVLAYPAILLWRRHAFERRRWQNSDFSPYATE